MSLERQAQQAAAGLYLLEEERSNFVSNAPTLVAQLRQERACRERQMRIEKLHALSIQLGVIAKLIEECA